MECESVLRNAMWSEEKGRTLFLLLYIDQTAEKPNGQDQGARKQAAAFSWS
jgi:hypothetical protein